MNKNTFLLYLFFYLIFFAAQAQETTVNHVVKKDETIIQIAQKYKVTPNDLYKLNPELLNGIQEGQTLLVPSSKVKVVPAPPKTNLQTGSTAVNLNTDVVYWVQPGETKFGLAKKFGISIAQLEEQNPHIVNGLQAGHKLILKNGYAPSLVSNTNFVSNSDSNTSKDLTQYTVLPGETLYGISKRHGLTVNQLLEINKNFISGVLKSGQTIQVPIKHIIASSKNETQSPKVSSETSIHIVQAGETKFGLSKKYNISIAELERLNPQIVKMLQTDQRLMVPKSVQGSLTEPKEVILSQKVNTEPNPQTDTLPKPKEVNNKNSVEISSNINWIDYEVQPKETLFGIAQKSGITVEQLLSKNPNLSEGLKAGSIIKVPSNTESHVQPLVAKTSSKTNSYSDLLSKSKPSVSKTITFILSKQTTNTPDFETYVKNSNSTDSEIEFYKGALYAIDSLRKLNFEINIDFQDVSQITIPSKKENKTFNSNIVFNFSDANVPQFVIDFCLKNNVPMVTRTTKENEKGRGNFVALPGQEEMNRVMFDFLNTENANIIVVNEFESSLNPLNGVANFSNLQMIQTSDKGILDTDLVRSKLSKNLKNYVVLNSERVGTVLNTTTFLLQESTVYPLQLVLLQPIDQFLNENYSANRFKALNTLYPVVNQSNPEEIKGFQNQYFKKHKTTANVNFIAGFDVTYDALIRLYQDLSFETVIKDYQTKGLMYQFWFKKNNNLNYSNHGVKIEQFSTSTD